MTRIKRTLWTVGLTLPVLFAGVAQAQHYGPNGPPVAQYDPSQDNNYPPPPPPQDGYGAPPTQGPSDMARTIQRRLRLRQDQDVALNSFVQAIAPPPGTDKRMQQDQVAARTMTTPQRLDMMISEMDQMRQLMLARAQATKLFYAQLSPDQQRAFDAMGADSGPGGMEGPGAYGERGEPPGGPNNAFSGGGYPHN